MLEIWVGRKESFFARQALTADNRVSVTDLLSIILTLSHPMRGASNSLPVLRLDVFHRCAAFLGVQVAFHIAERIGVVAQAVLDEIVGAERHVERQIFLHVGGDLRVLQCRPVAAADFFGQRLDETIKLFFRYNLGNKTYTFGFEARQIPTGEGNVESFLEWNPGMEKRRRRRGAVATTDDFGHAELG